MNLYHETTGSGPDLVLLHGWGLHGGIWRDLLDDFASQFRVTCIDLPGHGHSRDQPMPDNIAELADNLLTVAPATAHWLGWSLGGLAALQIAIAQPRRVRRLVMVASSPKFVTSGQDDWWGLDDRALAVATVLLESAYRHAVLNFLSLQVRGMSGSHDVLAHLRSLVFARGEPRPDALKAGMTLLRATDLRGQVRGVAAPTLVISGGRDRIAHPLAGQWLADALPAGRHEVFDEAGHAMFLSHPRAFVDYVVEFLGSISRCGVSAA